MNPPAVDGGDCSATDPVGRVLTARAEWLEGGSRSGLETARARRLEAGRRHELLVVTRPGQALPTLTRPMKTPPAGVPQEGCARGVACGAAGIRRLHLQGRGSTSKPSLPAVWSTVGEPQFKASHAGFRSCARARIHLHIKDARSRRQPSWPARYSCSSACSVRSGGITIALRPADLRRSSLGRRPAGNLQRLRHDRARAALGRTRDDTGRPVAPHDGAHASTPRRPGHP